GDVHDQERESADRHGQPHALQHTARHHSLAHRHVVERKGERAESSVNDAEQETPPSKTYHFVPKTGVFAPRKPWAGSREMTERPRAAAARAAAGWPDGR